MSELCESRVRHIYRVNQDHGYVGLARTVYAPYMTVYLMIFLPKIPYIHRIYMVLANSTYMPCVHKMKLPSTTLCVHMIIVPSIALFAYGFHAQHCTCTITGHLLLIMCIITGYLHLITCTITRVGQNHIYTVCIRYFWQGNHQIYGHIRCLYTVLANPNHNRTPPPHHVHHKRTPHT
jgi:hypothetical protein